MVFFQGRKEGRNVFKKLFKPTSALFFIETLQNLNWKICVRDKELQVSVEVRWGKAPSLCSELDV